VIIGAASLCRVNKSNFSIDTQRIKGIILFAMLNLGSNNATQITPVPGSNHFPPDFGIAPGAGIFRSITMEEIWKPVKGFEGRYDISNKGRVRSYLRIGSRCPIEKEPQRLLILVSNKKGYLCVHLCGGSKQTLFIHRMIADAFIPNPENKPLVLHRNDINKDNRLDNLYWGNQSENNIDAFRNNRCSQKGSMNCNAKLKEQDIPTIRELRKRGMKLKDIGKIFGVKTVCIHQVLSGGYWSHVKMALVQT
jgi:hypothetical protein